MLAMLLQNMLPRVIPQNELTSQGLYQEIERLLGNNFKMSQMRQQMLNSGKTSSRCHLTEQMLNLVD